MLDTKAQIMYINGLFGPNTWIGTQYPQSHVDFELCVGLDMRILFAERFIFGFDYCSNLVKGRVCACICIYIEIFE